MADADRETDCLMIEVFSEPLRKLWQKCDNLETVGTPYAFQPHMTLAFLKEHSALQYMGSNPFIETSFEVNNVKFRLVNGETFTISSDGNIL